MVAALLALTGAPALARSVGVEVDGKAYTFQVDGGAGEPARIEIDGKTFVVGEDEVIVQRPGEPDLHLALEDETSADAVAAAPGITRAWGAEYAAFAPYGLRCDAEEEKLYYMGECVRVFEDTYEVDGGSAELSYFDAAGTVDVRALRGADGALTGLERLSDAEFAARDLGEWTDPAPVRGEATATDGSEPTPEERANFFAPYAPFGLRYDAEANQLYFNDRPVRNFLDVRSSNGAAPTGGDFHGSLTQLRFEGEVDVAILRDYAHPDENGEGKLIRIEATEAK